MTFRRSMSPFTPARARRRALLASTTLMGTTLMGVALLTGTAQAQSLPSLANAGGASISTSGPVGSEVMTVNLNDASRIIDFNNYNIAAGRTVSYVTTTTSLTDLVAANRVLSAGGTSIINGTITAQNGISVWLFNQDGITFNGSAQIAGGSLLLSTLDFSSPVDGAFRTAFASAGAANSTAFNFAGSAASPIQINSAGLNVTGSIMAVGQSITNTAPISTNSGSVVLVAASDVTFNSGVGSPLNFTINAGTTLTGGVNVQGSLSGQSVVVAGALQNNLTATLLNVDAGATLTASDVNGAVVLATASTTAGANTITVNNGTNALASIAGNGALSAAGAGGDVKLVANDAVTVAGNVTAGQNYTVSGSGITLGAAATTVQQTAGGLVNIEASTSDITGLGALTLQSDAAGSGASALTLKADAGAVNFDTTTSLIAGLAGGTPTQRSEVVITSAPGLNLGNVTASSLHSASSTDLIAATDLRTQDITVDAPLTLTSTGGFVHTGAIAVGNAGADVAISANGATSDIQTGNIQSNGGNILLSSSTGINVADVSTGATAGSVGLLAGGTITATTLSAGKDIAGQGSAVSVGSATAGDDIDLVAQNGALSLTTGLSNAAVGAGLTGVVFGGAAGTAGSISIGAEDAQLGAATIRLRSAAGDVTSATSLTTNNGDVIVNAANNVSLNTVTATGLTSGSIAVRAGGNVTQALSLTSQSEDVSVAAGGSAALGSVSAADDIDITAASLSFTGLTLSGGADRTRYADVISGTAGQSNGVTFTTPDDAALAGANVVRLVVSGGVGGSVPTAPVGLLAGTVTTSGAFTANGAGDIRLGDVTSGGDIAVTSTGGSVTGLPSGYAAAGGGTITATGGKVLLSVGSGTFGAISTGAGGSVATLSNGADTLRIGTVSSGTVTLGAQQTLDVGTLTAGSATLTTAAGAADAFSLELIGAATRLAPGNGLANLTAGADNGRITVNAANGIAQLGTVIAGSGAGTLDQDQVSVSAQALMVDTVRARDGSLNLLASRGLLQVGTGSAHYDAVLTKNNADNASIGSDTITDVLRVDDLSAGYGVGLTSATSAFVTTQATAQGNDALRNTLAISAARNIGVASAAATTGSVGLLAGGTITATTLSAGKDIAGQGSAVSVGSATAGDDIDLVAQNGALSLTTGLSNAAVGAGLTGVVFGGAAGTAGSISIGAEDAQLGAATIRLRSAAGDVTSATSLTTNNGDVIVNAANNVSLNTVTATGLTSGSIAVRAGGNVTQALSLTSQSEDVSVAAGGSAALGSVSAADDIDITAASLSFTGLTLSGGADRTRYADVISGTAGQSNGVTFTTPDDAALAGANVVRLVVSGGVGGSVPTAPVGLLAGTVTTSGAFTANGAGDIRLGDVTSGGDIAVTSTGGSVTGLPSGYAAAGGGTITATGGKVLLSVGSGTFGAISTGAGGSVATLSNGADTLRIGTVSSGTVTLGAQQTLDVGTLTAGSATLTTAAGAADAFSLELIGAATRLAPGNGLANLTAGADNGRITVNAANGIAQLGTVIAGSGAGTLDQDQVSVSAQALMVDTVRARDGSLNLLASRGLLQVGTGSAHYDAVLTKNNADNASIGSDTITDVLRVDDLSAGYGVGLTSATSAFVTTQATAQGNDALRNTLAISAARNIGVASAAATTGSVGLLAGGTITATTLSAGKDIAGQGSAVSVGSATAGDDIDLVAQNGALSLTTGLSNAAVGAGLTGVVFGGAAGTAGSISIGAEDAQLGAATIRLRSAAGDVTSATSLTTNNGDVIVNAANNVSLNTVTATGLTSGSIAVRAGGNVTQALSLTSQSEDVSVAAGGSAALGSVSAADDIDITAASLSFTGLTLSGGADRTRYADVISGTAGQSNGVTFTTPDDAALAGANVVRLVVSGGVGGSVPTAPVGLLAGTVTTSGAFTANGAGDIRLGDVTSGGDIAVTSTGGSVTGLPSGYAAAGGGTITATGGKVLLSVGSGTFGAISTGAGGSVATLSNGADTLRIGTVSSGTVTLGAQQTLDVGTLTAGSATLTTAAGAADAFSLELIGAATRLAPGNGLANLTAGADNGRITVNAANGIAQLGTVIAGSGAGTLDQDQVSVSAQALMVDTVRARDGSLNLLASRGLLQVGTGSAHYDAVLTKNNADNASIGSDTITDVLRVDDLSAGYGVGLTSATSAFVTTQATAQGNDALRNTLAISAARNIGVASAAATTGSVGLLAGGTITATTLSAGKDIAGQGSAVSVGSATAGDDIDLVAQNGALSLTTGLSNAAVGAGLTGVVFGGAAGTAGSISIGAEDAQLGAATIRLRSAAGDVTSATSLTTNNGDVIVNAANNVSLNTVTATGLTSGSIAVRAGGNVTQALSLTSQSEDVSVAAGGSAALGSVSAADDIDITAASLSFTGLTLSGGADRTRYADVISGTAGQSNGVTFTTPDDAALAGANVVRLVVSGGVGGSVPTAPVGLLAGTVTTSGAFTANGAGDIRLGDVTSGGDIAVTSTGGSVTGLPSGYAAAGGGTITATGGKVLLSVGSGTFGAISTGAGGSVATLSNGADTLRIGTVSSGTVTLGAQQTLDVGTLTAGSATLTTAAGAADAFSLELIGAATRLAPGNGLANLTAGADNGRITVNAANGIAQLGTVIAGSGAGTLDQDQVSVSAQALMVDTVRARDGSLNLLASRGLLQVGTGSAHYDAVLTKNNADNASIGSDTITDVLRVDDLSAGYGVGLTSATSAFVTTQATAQGNDALRNTLAISAARNIGVASAAATTGSVGLLAGGTITATTLSAGKDIAGQGSAVSVGSATAGDDIDLVAQNGALSLTTGLSNAAVGAGLTGVVFGGAAGTAGSISIGAEDAQLGAATIRLRAVQSNVTSGTSLTTNGAGDILVNAKGNVSLAASTARRGSIALLAGGSIATSGATSASEDIAASAGTSATFAALTAGDDIELAAAGTVSAATATIGGSATGLDARHAVLTNASAGQSGAIALVSGDARGAKSLPSGSSLANDPNGRNIIIEASDVALSGNLTSSGRIILRNTGTGATTVGNSTSTAGNPFALSNAEMALLKAPSVIVDTGSKALEIGKLDILNDVATSDMRFTATGAVAITGPVAVQGTAQRTLQIGGLLDTLTDNAAAHTFATQITANLSVNGGSGTPSINAGSATVELRADRILFGTATMLSTYGGMDAGQIASQVANASSLLYTDPTAQNIGTFLTARQVTVGYKNFALFQNTQVSGNQGVQINSAGGTNPTALAIRLISTGDTPANSFAMFGTVDGFSGTSAATLTNAAIELAPAGSLNAFRVSRANSRINGCAIGAPDKGCLTTDVAQPNFNLYDERKVAVFNFKSGDTLAVTPLIGRGNDSLIVNVADAAVSLDTIECRPSDTNCPPKGGK
ncbi:filamentous hemagglutinin N-terminal domain-containing protein [Novosphingobium sp. KACC 22771]|uniref:filamentous hemagglutinin N-terminal domain-containing protein n=1 Tax=Novosphingobium sp. KACC 22771 TaxID=3025670 RepID=UPI00236611AA|nr:filamentous hemagglutinin N-terminal domain-containing protein [Novosphingobium sp. KACC 22771]WDF73086.1 filamentous hemagglutinin N-terminal domain-containing protein [Novosphingobium sp. KACC 22771]